MREKCTFCPSEAVRHYVWGFYDSSPQPKFEADLCESCSDQLWKKVGPQVNAGLCHFTVKSIPGSLVDRLTEQKRALLASHGA